MCTYLKEEAIKAVRENPLALVQMPLWKNDRDVVLAAMERCPSIIDEASDELKDDPDFALAAAKINGLVTMTFISERLQDDKDLVIAILEFSPHVFRIASSRLQKDEDVIRTYHNALEQEKRRLGLWGKKQTDR